MAGDDAKWRKAWSSGTLSGIKLPDLKAYLKGVGLPMAGDAAKRVENHLSVKFLDLFVLHDGKKTSPFELKPADLRRTVAQLGMDPSGDKDELHTLLIGHLKAKNTKESKDGAGGGDGAGPSSSSSSAPEGVKIAEQILSMSTDYPSVLSCSGTNITTDSSVALMRKAYLKLSLLIHPDKLQKVYPDATKAFQVLVNAYERLSQPELFLEEEEDSKKPKQAKISRSNDGCFRTALFCPRCGSEWGLPDSGVAPYDYNFIMNGLKLYNCAGCLFDFGCMTATHKCPHCRRPFDYHPSDYHRKINCPNPKCGKPIGFFLFHVSDRVEKEYRAEIRAKQEKLQKEREQLQGRSARAKSRGTAGELGFSGKLKLFIMNLLDDCPQCGEEVESSAEEREAHLKSCNDPKKQKEYQKRLKNEQELKEKRAKAKEAEEEAQNAQSWEYLGGKSTDMWLLTEAQVHALCASYKIPIDGQSKEELITKIVGHRNSLDSKRMLTDGSSAGEVAPKRKKVSLSPTDLPSNMGSMSVGQLKAFCAANEIPLSKTKATKSDIIKEINKAVFKDEVLRLK